MRRRSRDDEPLDITQFPAGLRATFAELLNGGHVTVVEQGRVLGRLVFEPRVLEGFLITPPAGSEQTPQPPRDDICVVATAMPLSEAARSTLSEGLGEHYIVLDLIDAPPTADVVLTQPISPQLLNKLQADFPAARIIVTEIDDEEAGVSYSGPVSRVLNAGATAYLPPRPLDQVAQNVRTHLEQTPRPVLDAPARTPQHELGASGDQ
mgnify:FL=1